MPRYEYKCPVCGEVREEFMRMCGADEAPPVKCNGCVGYMQRQVVGCHTDLQDFHTPIEMYSVACNSMEEIREMQRAGVECSDDPKSELFGVPVARNRRDKKAALRAANFLEK